MSSCSRARVTLYATRDHTQPRHALALGTRVTQLLLSTGQQPMWFRAPNTVYDFTNLQPQGMQTGEHSFIGSGMRDLQNDRGVQQQKQAVIQVVNAFEA